MCFILSILRRLLKTMTHQPAQLLSRVGSGPVGVCVIGLQLIFFASFKARSHIETELNYPVFRP